MSGVRPFEWGGLTAQVSKAAAVEGADGSAVVTIDNVAIPMGWSASATNVSFLVPVGYPAAQPDCFWSSADLRLATGAMPANAAVQTVPLLGRPGLWFSWHLSRW